MPALVGSPTVRHNNTLSSTYTGDYPTGITSGELLFAQANVSGAAVTPNTPPTGWNLILNTNSSAGNCLTYWKAATGAETGTVGFTAGSTQPSTVVITRISNANTVSPISASGSGSGVFTGTTTFPSIAPLVSSCLLICCAVGDSSATAGSWSGGLVEAWDAMTTATVTRHTYGGAESLSTAGSTGTRTTTPSTLSRYTAQSIAIAPPGSMGGDLVGKVGV